MSDFLNTLSKEQLIVYIKQEKKKFDRKLTEQKSEFDRKLSEEKKQFVAAEKKITALENYLKNEGQAQSLLLTRNILEYFKSKFLKPFLPDTFPHSSKEIEEAYKIFLSPGQNSYKKVKKAILASLTDLEIDKGVFVKCIGEIYQLCSSFIHTFKLKNEFSHETAKAIVSIASELSENDKKFIDVLNRCLKS